MSKFLTVRHSGKSEESRFQRGFTFIELLVVIFIYSILLAGTVDIFVSAQRAQRKTAALEKLQDDARFLIQTITQSFQAGGLDYSCYQQTGQNLNCIQGLPEDTSVGIDILAIKNFEGKTIQFKQSGDECSDSNSTPCVLVSDDNGNTWVQGSSEGVKVDTLKFYISPFQNPFQLGKDNDYLSSQQPRLTVVFGGTAAVKGFKETANIFIQTTVSSREYKR